MDVRRIVVSLLCVPIVVLVVSTGINIRIENRNAEMRSAMLSYLAQPQFSGQDFFKQLTGVEGKFQMYDLDERMVYISVPQEKFQGDETIKKLTRNPEAVEFAKNRFDEYQGLGEYHLFDLSQKFFRMRARTFRVDGDSAIETTYDKELIRYRVTVGELTDYLKNRVTWNGPDYFRYRSATGEWYRMANHGAFVSKREPSLQRFTRSVAIRAGSKEKAADALLYFVSNYIAYDTLEAMDDVQVMKHASEVLLTKRAVCSGKAILYASLLEQLGIDYLLAYEPKEGQAAGHIVVLVSGNFPNNNGYQTTVFSRKYSYADPTVKDFLIGLSSVTTKDPVGEIRFVQKPGRPVYDKTTGVPLEFVK